MLIKDIYLPTASGSKSTLTFQTCLVDNRIIDRMTPNNFNPTPNQDANKQGQPDRGNRRGRGAKFSTKHQLIIALRCLGDLQHQGIAHLRTDYWIK